METKEISEGTTLTLVITGRLDGLGAGKLQSDMMAAFERMTKAFVQVKTLVFDLSGVEYISSAGLRVLLLAYKHMAQSKGEMRIVGVQDKVMEVLAMTGMDKQLQIVRAKS